MKALEQGKHVLCEKPFAMDEAEAKAMVQAAQTCGKLLLEAFHYRFHPLFVEVMQLVQAGILALSTICGRIFRCGSRFSGRYATKRH
ncbi:Gfo/Idh/MocA family protein [Alishewanella longhuensis]